MSSDDHHKQAHMISWLKTFEQDSAVLATSSFKFGLPTYFVPHYGCRSALYMYAVFYRRVLLVADLFA